MISLQNPFRARASEHQRDSWTFLRHFAVGVLDLLPPTLWDRLLIIRSAPGGGKTSLMRLFSSASLELAHDRGRDIEPLHDRLQELGALEASGPRLLGVLLSLTSDYKALDAVGLPEDVSIRLFMRLLNARIAAGVIRAALEAKHLVFPDDAARVQLRLREDAGELDDEVGRIGGPSGDGILSTAREAERSILNLLDSLATLPDDAVVGHGRLYSLRVLSHADIMVDGHALDREPLIMLDDGHELTSRQRLLLNEQLRDRTLSAARWYSERFEALSPQEVVTGATEGRDQVVLELESAARSMGGTTRTRHRFERILIDLANLRAARTLERYSEGHNSFAELLESDDDARARGGDWSEIEEAVRHRVMELAGSDERYSQWISEAASRRGYDAAARWREIEILIARDKERPTRELFDMPLTEQDADRMSGSSVREASELLLAREFNLPYYVGPSVMARLGSHNIEQFLTICGGLFDEMLAEITLSRRPALSPHRQHAIVRAASETLWREIPRRLPYGRDVQQLLQAIASMCRRDTYRPTAPYAPGVTGTALSMRDRERILDQEMRTKLVGGERLFNALASAIAYNIVSAELDRQVKGNRWMVIYLNRLLCPRFDLPLGRGGFRERKLEAMAQWMIEPADQGEDAAEMSLPL